MDSSTGGHGGVVTYSSHPRQSTDIAAKRPADENANLTTDTDLAYKKALSAAGRTGPYIMCQCVS